MVEMFTPRPPAYEHIDLGFWDAVLHPRGAGGRFAKKGDSGASGLSLGETLKVGLAGLKTSEEAGHHGLMQQHAETYGKFDTRQEALASLDQVAKLLPAVRKSLTEGGRPSNKDLARLDQLHANLTKATVTLYDHHVEPLTEPKVGFEKAKDITKDTLLTIAKQRFIEIGAGMAALVGGLFGQEQSNLVSELVQHWAENPVGDSFAALGVVSLVALVARLVRKMGDKAIHKVRGTEEEK